MVINIPIETYKRHLEAKRILERIIKNSNIVGGIPEEDILAAKKIVKELTD
jgi:hypothetical protein